MSEFLPDLLDPLEIALLVTALLITIEGAVDHIISTYRVQSYLLAGVTGLTALIKLLQGESGFSVVIVLILLIIILPVGLAQFIQPILSRATVDVPIPRLRLTDEEKQEAKRVWRKSEAAIGTRAQDVFFFVGLVALAFLIAFQIIAGEFETSERIGLMVSLALHLVGLYNMVVKRDIISQVVGLLIMDHGLYLAVVKIVAIPVPATFFVIGLYFYTLITIAILIFLLPQVRRLTGNINLDEIARESDLEG